MLCGRDGRLSINFASGNSQPKVNQIMTRDIDIALLRAFVAVVETGSVTSASRLLNRTQAAVSLQIKRLEELLGLQLFEREHRKLSLMPAGEQLLAGARRMLCINDDVWSTMTTPDFEGEVRIGVPNDIVLPFLPPVLKSFDQAWPRVQVTLICDSSPVLLKKVNDGKIDLTLTTEIQGSPNAEQLLQDQLVWVGAKGGEAHLRSPLPVSVGSSRCAFRPPVIEAMTRAGLSWRTVCENHYLEPLIATVEADLAIMSLLISTVPGNLEILGCDSGLPPLPSFFINMYLPPGGASEIANELARHIRYELAARHPTLRVLKSDAA